MASMSRIGLLRQSQLLLSQKTPTLTSRATSQALRYSSSSITRRTASPLLSTVERLAPFSTSLQRKIMPPGPQVIEGGVNDPAPVPPPSPIHGSYHWSFERLLSVGLIPLTIAPFAAGSVSPVLDSILVFSIIIHSHIGFQACIVDYFSTTKWPKLRKFFDWTLNIVTVLVAYAFYEFETNDVGLAEGIKRVWHAGSSNDATVGKVDIDGLGHDGKLKHLKV